MKDSLPGNHGLTPAIESSHLIHKKAGTVSITDAQYQALAAGVATGESLLLVSPTSSGKTEVGLIGIATWLSSSHPMTRRAVYLVSHRALARQKFKELNAAQSLELFGLEPAE